MTKTSVKYCRKCIYSYKHSQTEIMCGYYLQTRLRRGCPVGMCDKFEKKGRKRKRVVWHENGWCTNEPGCNYYEELDDFDSENFEVIGNMIDNPELLEV